MRWPWQKPKADPFPLANKAADYMAEHSMAVFEFATANEAKAEYRSTEVLSAVAEAFCVMMFTARARHEQKRGFSEFLPFLIIASYTRFHALAEEVSGGPADFEKVKETFRQKYVARMEEYASKPEIAAVYGRFAARFASVLGVQDELDVAERAGRSLSARVNGLLDLTNPEGEAGD